MLYYALMFLLLGVVAAALGLSVFAIVTMQISCVLFIIGIELLSIHVKKGSTPLVT